MYGLLFFLDFDLLLERFWIFVIVCLHFLLFSFIITTSLIVFIVLYYPLNILVRFDRIIISLPVLVLIVLSDSLLGIPDVRIPYNPVCWSHSPPLTPVHSLESSEDSQYLLHRGHLRNS